MIGHLNKPSKFTHHSFNNKSIHHILKSGCLLRNINLAITLSIFLSPLYLMAQQHWTGLVVDSLDRPIPFVFIHNETQDRWTMTDEYGEFILPSFFNIDDSVYLSRIGFQTAKIQLPDFEYGMYILMFPNPIALNSINVSAQSLQSKQKKEELFSVSKTPEMGNIEHKQLLAGIPGLSLRTYGGPAGISTLSLDGGPASQTKIIVYGFDLTNAQNGVMDISQLPTPFIEKATFIPQTADYYGSGSSDGIIILDPWSGKTGLSISTGSFGHSSTYGTLSIQRQNWIGNLLLGQRHDDGDYPVKWRGQKFRRKNNDFDQKYFSLQSSIILSKLAFLKFLFLQSYQERGVASQVWSPDIQSHRNDNLQTAGLTFGWIGRQGYGSLQTMIRRSWENYNNPSIGIDSNNRLSTFQLVLKQITNLNQKIKLDIQLEAKEDRIASSDTDSHFRRIFSGKISTPYRIVSFLEFQPTYCYEVSPDLYSENTYEIGLFFPLIFFFINSISIHKGLYFRYPTFNDLYWKPGGNPDLKPEHSDKISAQVVCRFNKQGDLRIHVFRKTSDDLIQWNPVHTYWQPMNVQHAERSGWKIIWSWFSETIPLKVFVNYCHLRTENQSSGSFYGKPLRYAPEKTAATRIDWQSGNWSFHAQIHYTSEMISMYSWPEDITVNGVAVATISASHTWKSPFGSFILTGTVDNLTNKKYETVLGYPEPGRAYRLTISYKK